jgi:hypothetical protein
VELASETAVSVISGLDAQSYLRHALHDSQCIWTEKNCYIDLWIELVHAKGHEPMAMLPFVIQMDFEGDQWTFFKPSHDELRSLYGIKVHELTLWRALAEHVMEHLQAGRLVCLEVDAYWLPDTHGTDYKTKHSKTTIAINAVNLSTQEIGYFHNAGYFVATGEDFRQLLKLEPVLPELPLFAEIVSFFPPQIQTQAQCQQASLALMKKQIHYIPAENPITKFAIRFERDLPLLQARGLDYYHAWAFAGIRQCGSAFELLAAWTHWMRPLLPESAVVLEDQFRQISTEAKTLILKGARAVASKKAFDTRLQLQQAAAIWAQSTTLLKTAMASMPA